MKKALSIFLSVLCIVSFVTLAGCSGGTQSSNDYSQVFERIIAGDMIAEYIPFGSDGLVSEYEYVEHVYHYGDARAWMTIFRPAYS